MKINSINSYNYKISTTQSHKSQRHTQKQRLIFFGKDCKLSIAQKVLNYLVNCIEKSLPLPQEAQQKLTPFFKLFGATKIKVNSPDNPSKIIKIDSTLNTEKINKFNGIKNLAYTIKTMIEAKKYKPKQLSVGGIKYTVHNKKIAKLLKPEYTTETFSKITDYLNRNRIFDMTDNQNFGLIVNKEKGIVKTCGASENWEMSDRAWITDIIRVGDIQKIKRPESWTKALNTVAEYYQKQSENFKRLIKNPSLYRNGGIKEGIPHIFMPKTLEPDNNWFNNKRLESHGLALKAFCNTIVDGLVKDRAYGYKTEKSIPQNIVEAIDNLSKYFKAIKYPSAPSAGNWEEIPLKGGLTSDTEAIRSALNTYRDLLYNNKYAQNKEIQKIRARFKKLNALSENELNRLIKNGEARVRKTYLQEAPNIRPYDSSLVFITTSDIKLADNVYDDVKKHTQILELLEKKLVRENGIIRYAPFKFQLKDGRTVKTPDSYLNLNYFNAIDNKGKINLDWKNILEQYASKDCSDTNMFYARSKLSSPQKEAQWFMVSEMSTGYGKQVEKLINNAKNEKRKLTNNEKILIKKLKEKQTEYLNRALARISDENPDKVHQIKANGQSMPRVTVSEAHQYVTDIDGKPKMLQGTNAPLAWAVASLYKALRQQSKIIKMKIE